MQGFDHLSRAIQTCSHARADNIRHTLLMMLQEAKELSKSEIDYHISDKQNRIAKAMYQQKTSVTTNGEKYNIQMMPSLTISSGNGYRLITRMNGIEFNDLSTETNHDKEIKRTIAYAVMQKELLTILSGGCFDSDRHGNQLRVQIDSHTVKLGLYDFGEMATELPTQSDIQQLVSVIRAVPDFVWKHETLDNVFDAVLSEHIEKTHNTRYLLRIRKALLALHDFQQWLTVNDLKSIILDIAIHHQDNIHSSIRYDLMSCLLKVGLIEQVNTLSNAVKSAFKFFQDRTHHHAKSIDVGQSLPKPSHIRMT